MPETTEILIFQMTHSLYRRLNKSSLLFYLLFLRMFPSKKIKENEGSILVLADLFLGDLAMAGRLIIQLKKENPSRRIILLSKFNLSDASNLFDVEVINADYLNWRILGELRKASPEGYGKVINIFSWKWLSLLEALPYGEVISHLGRKSRSNKKITKIIPIADKAVPASIIIFDLIQSSIRDIKNNKLKTQNFSHRFNHLQNYLIIHIGASSKAKLWPLDLLDFLLKLSVNIKKTIVLTGLEQEKSYQVDLNKLIESYNKKILIEDLVGKTNIIELLRLAQNAHGVISVDTGIVHWARLFAVPNLSITGPADINLYGGNKFFFDNSRSVSSKTLECQDKKTFHGIKIEWMASCTRGECPLPSRLCFDNINRQQIEKDFFELFG